MAVSEQDAYHALAFQTGRYTSTPFKEGLCRLVAVGGGGPSPRFDHLSCSITSQS